MSLIVDNGDLDEHWEIKVSQRNELLLKCMEPKRNED